MPRPQGPACDIGAVEYVHQGYWMGASDGGIFSFGNAQFYGSMGGKPLNKPVVGMAATADSRGYWEVASDGGVFNFGDAGFHGSMGGKSLNAPMVGIAGTSDNGGYWEVASDGGIFNFGDAGFYGSMGGKPLNKPIVGMAATPDGGGYWEVASDGGIFSFGDAHFYGSTGAIKLNKPVVGMAVDCGRQWLLARGVRRWHLQLRRRRLLRLCRCDQAEHAGGGHGCDPVGRRVPPLRFRRWRVHLR